MIKPCFASQKVKDELYKLEAMKPGSDEFHRLLSRMMVDLHRHNDDEEIDDLPLLEPAIGEQASRQSAQSFKTTKKFVPTRLGSTIDTFYAKISTNVA